MSFWRKNHKQFSHVLTSFDSSKDPYSLVGTLLGRSHAQKAVHTSFWMQHPNWGWHTQLPCAGILLVLCNSSAAALQASISTKHIYLACCQTQGQSGTNDRFEKILQTQPHLQSGFKGVQVHTCILFWRVLNLGCSNEEEEAPTFFSSLRKSSLPDSHRTA